MDPVHATALLPCRVAQRLLAGGFSRFCHTSCPGTPPPRPTLSACSRHLRRAAPYPVSTAHCISLVCRLGSREGAATELWGVPCPCNAEPDLSCISASSAAFPHHLESVIAQGTSSWTRVQTQMRISASLLWMGLYPTIPAAEKKVGLSTWRELFGACQTGPASCKVSVWHQISISTVIMSAGLGEHGYQETSR